MPSLQSLILATLAAMATIAAAAPGVPRVPILIEDPWPSVVARSGVSDGFLPPKFTPPVIEMRTPGGPTVYLPPVKDISPEIVVRAPDLPTPSPSFRDTWLSPKIVARAPITDPRNVHTGPPPFQGTWPELPTGGILARAPNPAPASSSVTEPSTGLAEVRFTVGCGCWNICTLEKVVNKDLVCEAVCDPEYQCDPVPIARNFKAVERDNSNAAMMKRGSVSGSVKLGPGGKVVEVVVTGTISL